MNEHSIFNLPTELTELIDEGNLMLTLQGRGGVIKKIQDSVSRSELKEVLSNTLKEYMKVLDEAIFMITIPQHVALITGVRDSFAIGYNVATGKNLTWEDAELRTAFEESGTDLKMVEIMSDYVIGELDRFKERMLNEHLEKFKEALRSGDDKEIFRRGSRVAIYVALKNQIQASFFHIAEHNQEAEAFSSINKEMDGFLETLGISVSKKS